jgi:hypothetical protein
MNIANSNRCRIWNRQVVDAADRRISLRIVRDFERLLFSAGCPISVRFRRRPHPQSPQRFAARAVVERRASAFLVCDVFPSTDIRYNFLHREWFAPFDIEIGREISKSLQAGPELAVPMLQGNFPVYKFKAEAHVTFLFR